MPSSHGRWYLHRRRNRLLDLFHDKSRHPNYLLHYGNVDCLLGGPLLVEVLVSEDLADEWHYSGEAPALLN